MSLKFALNWNVDHDKGGTIRVNGTAFGFNEARAVLRNALALPGGSGLQEWIDKHQARVINGPHKSADPQLHMTVLCKSAAGREACFHVYVSRQGNASSVSPAPTTKKGHVHDDLTAPVINTSQDL